MSSLLGGYRPPQFSEESAWLPCWFQHQHDEKDVDYQFTNKCTREDAIMSLEDEGRYMSCHLFLSGEDMPSASFCPSSANVGDFHLHLSSDGTTQDFYSSGLGTFKAGSDHVALLQKTGCTMDHDARETRLQPLTSQHEILDHACLESLKKNNDTQTNNEDNVRKHKVSEISKAVELSNAAAEALIIHDMVKSSSSTKCLSTAAILEVALRVKQARVEGLEDIPYCSEQDNDEDESMSDFLESDMEDAFEDVGLVVCGSDDLLASGVDISQVKETPNSETHPPNGFLVDVFTEQEPANIIDMVNQVKENFSVELVDIDGKRKLKDDPTSDLTASTKAPHNDTGLRWSVEKSNVPAATEGPYLDLENMTPPLKEAKVACSPKAEGSVNDERDDKLHLSGSVGFQSRWLGGWMKRDSNASETTARINPNLISKLLIGETSSLSESADVAPDENSHVRIQDEGSHMASPPSIVFKGLHDGADDGVIFSPNTPVPSCSSADPLCSVVPCSLSSENTLPLKNHDSNIVEDTEELLRPALEHCNDYLPRTTTSTTEFVRGDQQPVQKINGEASHIIIGRHLTSLRRYSTISPKGSAFMEKDRNHGKPSPNNSRFNSTEENSCVRGIGEKHELSNQIRQDESETLARIQKDRQSPLVLNRGKRHRFSVCKEVDLIDREKTSEKAPIPKGNHQKDRLRCGVDHNPEIPPRKRVRFSEACTQRLHKTSVHRQSSHIECSAAGAGKRIKKSNVRRSKKFQSPHKDAKGLVLRNLEFLLTGFPVQKEKEIKNLIRKHDGTVLPGIPSSNPRGRRISRLSVQRHPVVLCPCKVETTEFLYGCAVYAFILRVDWLTDSVKAGSALAPDKYMVIFNHVGERSVARPLCCNKHNCLFDGVGIMLHGKQSFCTRLATVIKHGGGKVFKTLQLMVQNLDTKKISSGIIVAEDERSVSRHLKHCASEGKIHTVAASWIINSLHLGKLLPFNANLDSSCLPKIRILDFPDSAAFSEEI